MQRWSSIVGLLAVLSFTSLRALAQQPVEIRWDAWGVPHIDAVDREAALYAFGWAQMQAHAELIVRSYVAARGQAAAYAGEGEFQEDALVHQLGIPERARAVLAEQEPRYRGYLEAFARGLNDYVAHHPDAVSASYHSALPLTAADVLAHIARVQYTRFLFYQDRGAISEFAERAADAAPNERHGSNAYAIAPSRSASGHALLLINPHLPWPSTSPELTLFEAQIAHAGHFFYGAALVGQPMFAMGFNEALGWAHTVNDADALDTYELTLRDGGYVFDGQTRAFEELPPAHVEVRGSGGKRELRSVPRRASVHGPVVFSDRASGRALAVRFSAGAIDQLVRRYWLQADARDVNEFEAAADRDRLGCFNTLYADRQGHVLYRYEAVLPRRHGGDYASWQGIQPGDSAANLWRDVYDRSALPRLLDPASGFVQNANDPPWYASLPPLDAGKFPPYIAAPVLDYRAQQSLRRVAADASISFDELVALKQSNRVEMADRFLPPLLAACQDHPELEPARKTLAAWNRELAPDAKGAVLFLAWVDAMNEQSGLAWAAEAWSASAALETPRGLRDEAVARRALARASAQVVHDYGRLQVSYGTVYRLRGGRFDVPASAGSTGYGVYSAAEFQRARDGKQVAYSGDTFVAAIEFSDPPHAQGLLSYGNATQKSSPFVGDQLPLFSRRELRPLWLTRADVDAHLHGRELLRYTPQP